MDAVELARNELVDYLMKCMVTPNLTQQNHSKEEESSYNNFIRMVKLNHDYSVLLPLDYAIRNEMFSLIKEGKAFIESSVKFQTKFTTNPPTTIDPPVYSAKYRGNEFNYAFLDNHPGIINVDKLKDIPTDYEGLMAVPPTILEYKNLIRFNIHRIIYTPIYRGKHIYPRVVVSNKATIA